ncbi:Cyclin-dependent kinase inhibitor [Heracleum sosnowskyi]|uniref:Cyclin-dependent kinase inhibitor n=1 Tax=Heracleum sosnowskyi TaxID=360622 RepID=A0AAD8H0V4_9APIA|nr:Cyclin-dependent kinase inhibitor [Heracleum sosnowskyi]
MEISHARAAENSTSPARTAVSSDQSEFCRNQFYDKSSRSADLEVENSNSKTDNSTSMNSREFSSSSLSDVMETTTKKKTKNKASSAQKKPSMAEIEDFFSVAEKYEAKRFAEKYNYDIVKDVPLEGKYQWVRIKQ